MATRQSRGIKISVPLVTCRDNLVMATDSRPVGAPATSGASIRIALLGPIANVRESVSPMPQALVAVVPLLIGGSGLVLISVLLVSLLPRLWS